jgi:hypothetical protein
MTTKLFLRIAAGLMLGISLALQASVLFFVAHDMLSVREVGFGSVFYYATSLPFSIPAYLVANSLIYGAKIAIPMRWAHGSYFGLHVAILIFIFAFPGKFSP